VLIVDEEVDDLNKWVEALEDEFEPIFGVSDDIEVDVDPGRRAVLDNGISKPQQEEELRLPSEDKFYGTTPSIYMVLIKVAPSFQIDNCELSDEEILDRLEYGAELDGTVTASYITNRRLFENPELRLRCKRKSSQYWDNQLPKQDPRSR
jgi:hypothetical protein